MENNKGQLWIFAAAAILVLAVGIGYYSLTEAPKITGKVVDNSDCQTIDVAANFNTVGLYVCEGTGDSSASCTMQLQNAESDTISAQPIFTCTTSDGSQQVIASKQTLSAGQTGTFSVSFNNNGKDWKCKMSNAQTTKPEYVCQ